AEGSADAASGSAAFRCDAADGTERWLALSVASSPLAADAVAVVITDVTGRKRLESELRRQEENLSLAHSLAKLAIWEWDLTTDRITWSREMVELVRPGETPPTSFSEVAALLGPDEEARVRAAVDEAIRAECPLDIDTALLGGDGRLVYLHTRARVMRDAEGKPLRLVGMAQDITATKRSEDALRHSESRYGALLQQIDDVIYSLDTDGRFTTISGAFERLTGFKADDWVGHAFVDILDEASVGEAIRNFSERLTKREAGRAEYVVRGRDGKLMVEASNAPFFVDGELVGIVGVARDVTKAKLQREAADRDRRLNSLAKLAASAAHEFNNVLMSILPFAELVRRLYGDDERARNATEHIATAVRRGRQISQQILGLSRPASPALEPIELDRWLETFQRDASTSLGARYPLSVTNECQGALVIGDRALIDQVATNLITNAREAMPSGGEITIRAWRPYGYAIGVSITDRGVGVAPEHLPHVFDPMFTTRHGSSGLGLTVANEAMTLQNGDLKVESTPGEGSTFTMIFREAPAVARTEVSPAGDREPLRVLLVEDEEAIAIGIGMLLEGDGVSVRIASRGADVLPAIEEFSPHVTVLDVSLPDANGLDLLRAIRQQWHDHPVIFSTGHRDADTLTAVHEQQLPTIRKPFDVAELLALIRATLAQRKP
ncbi:MAG: PAS domain S-box protein, partial [Thermoanaerobaculia bacterium]